MFDNAINAINKATEDFTGRDWTTGPDALLSLLEKGKLSTEFDGGHGWWTANGSFEGQDLNRRWRRLLSDVGEADEVTPDLIERAEEFVAAEDAHVEKFASDAADEGRAAIELLKAGDYGGALDHVKKAASYEREFGDDPAWGPAVKALKELVELAQSVDEADALAPGQAWAEYVGDQSVSEWLANDGPEDADGIETYLAQSWPKDTTEATRPVIARRMADYIAAQA